jgi:hypothetical protein
MKGRLLRRRRPSLRAAPAAGRPVAFIHRIRAEDRVDLHAGLDIFPEQAPGVVQSPFEPKDLTGVVDALAELPEIGGIAGIDELFGADLSCRAGEDSLEPGIVPDGATGFLQLGCGLALATELAQDQNPSGAAVGGVCQQLARLPVVRDGVLPPAQYPEGRSAVVVQPRGREDVGRPGRGRGRGGTGGLLRAAGVRNVRHLEKGGADRIACDDPVNSRRGERPGVPLVAGSLLLLGLRSGTQDSRMVELGEDRPSRRARGGSVAHPLHFRREPNGSN